MAIVVVVPPESAVSYCLDALVTRAHFEHRTHNGRIAATTRPPSHDIAAEVSALEDNFTRQKWASDNETEANGKVFHKPEDETAAKPVSRFEPASEYETSPAKRVRVRLHD